MSEHKINEQWIENGRMYKAVKGPKIVNGLMEGNTCHGCCYVDKWDDDCLNPNQACPVGKGVIVKDLGPVNEDGLLPCPFCGEYPNLENNGYFWYCCTNDDCLAEVGTGKTKQEAIDIWNRRA